MSKKLGGHKMCLSLRNSNAGGIFKILFLAGILSISNSLTAQSRDVGPISEKALKETDNVEKEPAADSQERAAEEEFCSKANILVKRQRYKAFEIAIRRDPEFMCEQIELRKKTQTLGRERILGGHFYFGLNPNKSAYPFKHLLNKKSLELVFGVWSGGAHCCHQSWIVSLGESLQTVLNIHTGSYYPNFYKKDKNRIARIELRDPIMSEVFSCSACSPAGRVIMRFQDGRYQVDGFEMLRRGSNLSKLSMSAFSLRLRKSIQKAQQALLKEDSPELPKEFTQPVIDFAYSDSFDTVEKFVDAAWPKVPIRPEIGKEEFIKKLKAQLTLSDFYPEFESQLSQR